MSSVVRPALKILCSSSFALGSALRFERSSSAIIWARMSKSSRRGRRSGVEDKVGSEMVCVE